MKKLLVIFAITILAAGCRGPQGPQGPQGPAGSLNKFTLEYTIYSQDWSTDFDNNGNFIGYWHEIELPELTRNIYETGLYAAYLWDNNIQIPLPLIVYNETDGSLWQKKISCDFAIGSAAIYYQENDFMNENQSPATMTFRIQLVW